MIPRAIQHMPRPHYLCLKRMSDQLENKLACTMDGICKMVKKSLNPWSSHPITQNSQMSQKESRLFLASGVYSTLGFIGNVRTNVTVTRMTVSTSASLSSSH